MLKSCIATMALCAICTGLYAEEFTSYTNPCEGRWTLQNGLALTATRAEDSLTLQVPRNATILDCAGNLKILPEESFEIKVAVWCSNSTEQGGVIYVQKIQITCD